MRISARAVSLSSYVSAVCVSCQLGEGEPPTCAVAAHTATPNTHVYPHPSTPLSCHAAASRNTTYTERPEFIKLRACKILIWGCVLVSLARVRHSHNLSHESTAHPRTRHSIYVVPRGLEPRTLRLLAVRSDQLSYETHENLSQDCVSVLLCLCRVCLLSAWRG